MPFRGYFELNRLELTNTSRIIAHLGMEPPTQDVGFLSPSHRGVDEEPPGSGLYIPDSPENPPSSGLYDVDQDHWQIQEMPPGSGLYTLGECTMTEVSEGLYEIPPTSTEVDGHPLLYTPPDGATQYGPLIWLIEDGCWGSPRTCPGCKSHVDYDDSWPGLREWLDDPVYRTELAPWFTTRSPESAEFAGVWVTSVRGLDATPISRPIIELVGSGATAGPNRDPSRTVAFEALLVACSNAGLEYGLDWFACRLREAAEGTDSTLRYFNSHPSHTAADTAGLVREVHGVVYKTALEVTDRFVTDRGPNRQANIYKVTWEFAVTRPYAYAPPINLDLVWDEMQTQSIQWVHAPQCTTPQVCQSMPVLFSATCKPETVDVVSSPPPSCGGCMPVCNLETYVYHVPTLEFPLRCHETAVSMTIKNTGTKSLTMQGYWRSCIADPKCEETLFPVQIAGLPATAMLSLDAIDGRYWAIYEDSDDPQDRRQARITPGLRGRRLKPVGIVGTPNGSPWTPPVIDREGCWQFVALAPPGSDFEIKLALADREA